MGGLRAPPREENEDLPDFTPERAHMLFQGVYGYFLHHNNGSHLDRRFVENDLWQHRWRRISAQSEIWYTTPSGAGGRRFTAILAA